MRDRSRSLVALLRHRTEESPDRGYTWLAQGEETAARLTFAELDRRARAIAARAGGRGAARGAGAPALSPWPRIRGGVLRLPLRRSDRRPRLSAAQPARGPAAAEHRAGLPAAGGA